MLSKSKLETDANGNQIDVIRSNAWGVIFECAVGGLDF